MTIEAVTITVPYPPQFVDRHAVKLEAKRTIVPAATDTHGTRIVAHGAGVDVRGVSNDTSWFTVEVATP